MTMSKKLREYLQKEKITFEPLHHAVAYTASEVAGSQHVSGKEMLKTVIIKVDGKLMMCVVPAIYNLDFDKLKKFLGAKSVELAKEEESGKIFTDSELGAEPPIGSLYNIEMIADEDIKANDMVVFNAGSHTDTIKMKANDYLKMTKPRLGHFGKHV